MTDIADRARRREKCTIDRHPDHALVRRKKRNGAIVICTWCYTCDRNVSKELDRRKRTEYDKEAVARYLATQGATLEDLPLVEEDRVFRMCYYCDSLAMCEDDHVMERTIHGDFAEKGPIVPACPKCHGEKTENLKAFMRKLRGESAA